MKHAGSDLPHDGPELPTTGGPLAGSEMRARGAPRTAAATWPSRHRRSGPGRSGVASVIAGALVTVLIIIGAVIGPADEEAQGALAGDAVKPGNRAALSLVPDEPDRVPRLERFRAAYPEVVILLRGTVPKAWVGGRKIARPTLHDLLDDLEKMFPRDAGGG